jgi:uncharacterized membrane protein
MNEYEHSEGVRSTAAMLGHPIHPILVSFPISFLSGALLSDLAYLFLREPFWAQASLWLVAAGVVSGLLAAIFGLTDFLTIRRARHATGWIHLIGNLLAVLLSLGSLIIRLGNREGAVVPLGLALSAIVAGILLVTGWMGGELAFRYKVGVIGTERRDEEPTTAASQRQRPPS